MKRQIPAALLAGLFVAQSALAYEQQLSPSDVRDAYYLGRRNDDKLRQTLAQYVQRPALPASGPYVSEVEVRTPFSQAVIRSWRTHNYSAQQAAEDYRSRPQHVYVRVRINVTPTFVPSGPDFWRDFKFAARQQKSVPPQSIVGYPVYDFGEGFTMISGAEVYLVFTAEQIANEPLVIEVESPSGQRAEARFDLTRLR